MRPIAGLLGCVVLALAAPAAAGTYAVTILGPMDLGTVVTAATGDTIFRIDAGTGSAIVQSGSGRRVSTASARSQVQISCRPDRVGDTSCDTDKVPVRIGAIGALTGRARTLRNFTAGINGATMAGPPSGSAPLSFKLGPIGGSGSTTLSIGADFAVAGDDSGLPSGDGANSFYVDVTDNSGQHQLAGDTNNGKVRALRALAIAKMTDLNFGRIQRPTNGASTVTLSAATGARSVSGNGAGFATPAPTVAAFTVSGEGGQQVSLTVPTQFNLTGPATLSVTVNTTASATPTLSGTLGSGGTYGFSVGGAFAITNATPVGAYAGVLAVSVDYN
ncbi:MAG: DUF4402 domain-containing protein [Caulobacterales bacterium]|nr:DUF4402 domain-containing protein [Caulobacterales bacterium]